MCLNGSDLVAYEDASTAGVGNLRPAGPIRPAKNFHTACDLHVASGNRKSKTALNYGVDLFSFFD